MAGIFATLGVTAGVATGLWGMKAAIIAWVSSGRAGAKGCAARCRHASHTCCRRCGGERDAVGGADDVKRRAGGATACAPAGPAVPRSMRVQLANGLRRMSAAVISVVVDDVDELRSDGASTARVGRRASKSLSRIHEDAAQLQSARAVPDSGDAVAYAENPLVLRRN